MQIYLQSRSKAPHQDYRWHEVTPENTQAGHPPPWLSHALTLLDDTVYSLALGHTSEGATYLVVTGLPSQREDFQRRIIRNAVAWVGDAAPLQHFAAQLLQQGADTRLRQQVDTLVTEQPGGILKADYAALQQLAAQGTTALPRLPPDLNYKIGKRGNSLQQQLADELRQADLPPHEGAWIVVTEGKEPATLEAHRVWRALTDLEDSGQWRRYQGQPFSLSKMRLALNTALQTQSEEFLGTLSKSARKWWPQNKKALLLPIIAAGLMAWWFTTPEHPLPSAQTVQQATAPALDSPIQPPTSTTVQPQTTQATTLEPAPKAATPSAASGIVPHQTPDQAEPAQSESASPPTAGEGEKKKAQPQGKYPIARINRHRRTAEEKTQRGRSTLKIL